MIKRILVATDASEYSCRALAFAVDLAKPHHAEICLLHTVLNPVQNFEAYSGSYSYSFSEDEINEIGRKVFKATLAGIDVSDITIKTKTVLGYPAAVILDESKKNIDLVIMGSRGLGPIAGKFMGSVSLRILAEAPCPVLMVK